MVHIFPADVKTRSFQCLLQQLRFWSFLLSSVSWQSLFSQFFLKSGLTLLVHMERSLKATVLVFVCSITNCHIVNGLKQHIYFLTLL